MSSSGVKVPAWKRLGLQLKSGGAAASPSTPAPSINNFANDSAPSYSRGPASTPQTPALGKRKFPAYETPASGHAAKFARRDNSFTQRGGAEQRSARTVSFSSTTKDAPSRTPAPKTPKRAAENPETEKIKKPAKKAPPRAPPNLDKAVEYLRQWRDSRDSWKFNKNHTTMMIKYVFEDGGVLPATDIDTFYQYIRGMQGFSRTRLLQSATEVRDKDEAAKATGFAEGVKNAEGKQEKYETMISDFKARAPDDKYSEAKFLTEKVDKFIAKRLVKRMRAEMVLYELANDQDVAEARARDDTQKVEPAKEDGRKTTRPRKSRTAPAEESSDESSEDESDDDTSSSGSSDEDGDQAKTGKPGGDSSSLRSQDEEASSDYNS